MRRKELNKRRSQLLSLSRSLLTGSCQAKRLGAWVDWEGLEVLARITRLMRLCPPRAEPREQAERRGKPALLLPWAL
ncbi:MAG: hypothetical protein EBX17_03380 [Betaproteobacteria bacterium]|nr:hypothetical protein [Betaproteobacteria bacterium]NCX22225.1 hypothetical protein [Betaproteobacteria bacterium]